jgi:hypothetical protein
MGRPRPDPALAIAVAGSVTRSPGGPRRERALRRHRPFLLACGLVAASSLLPGFARQKAAGPAGGSSGPHDGQHDFDFEIGTWKTHLARLLHPLTGSTAWVEYEGTTVVRKVWDGRANLVELVADGPAGHFEGLSLRLYNPESRQWSLHFASSRAGSLSTPTIGEFRNGRGEFFDQEMLDGRAILVRFVIVERTPNSCRFEQSFSSDGGRSWELNWVATDTRIDEPAMTGRTPAQRSRDDLSKGGRRN